MNFLDLESIKDELKSIKRIPEDDIHHVSFDYIVISNFFVKIRAGNNTASEPRVFLKKITDYSKVEVVIHSKNKNNELTIIKPFSDDLFKSFEWTKYFTFLDLRNKMKSAYVGEFIPIDILPIIIKDIYRTSRLFAFN